MRPVVQIIGPGGGDLVGRLGERLSRVTIVDQAGMESDELVFEVRVEPPFPAGPAKDTRFSASIGWEPAGLRMAGVYSVQNHTISGDPEQGYFMTVNCRAVDFIDAAKKVDSEHFEEMTVGAIFAKLAGAAGMTAVVAPEIASIEVPYRLRWNQSVVDFATELAEDFGGTMKLAGGKMLVPVRGSGKAAGGMSLPPIIVPFRQNYGFDISIEGRGLFHDIGGGWFDILQGIDQLFAGIGLGTVSRFLPLHPFPTQAEAEKGGTATARELARKTLSGSFDMRGDPLACAEAKVIPQGFGGEIDGLDLVCACATHEVTFDDSGGWITTVEVEGAT